MFLESYVCVLRSFGYWIRFCKESRAGLAFGVRAYRIMIILISTSALCSCQDLPFPRNRKRSLDRVGETACCPVQRLDFGFRSVVSLSLVS